MKQARVHISSENEQEREFLDFILSRYIESGWEELSAERLPQLLRLRYGSSISDAQRHLGKTEDIRERFFSLQEELYQV